jgi:hypothetical protein
MGEKQGDDSSQKLMDEIQQEGEDSASQKLVSLTGIRISPVPSPAEMEGYERLSPGTTKKLF